MGSPKVASSSHLIAEARMNELLSSLGTLSPEISLPYMLKICLQSIELWLLCQSCLVVHGTQSWAEYSYDARLQNFSRSSVAEANGAMSIIIWQDNIRNFLRGAYEFGCRTMMPSTVFNGTRTTWGSSWKLAAGKLPCRTNQAHKSTMQSQVCQRHQVNLVLMYGPCWFAAASCLLIGENITEADFTLVFS